MKKQELINAHLLAFAVGEARLNKQTMHFPMYKDSFSGQELMKIHRLLRLMCTLVAK